MTCKHQFQMLPGQDIYQWCPDCGSIFNIQENKGRQPRLLDLVEVKHIDLNTLEKNYCKEGNKIMAIKLLRERTGLPLYQTKRLVDAYMEKHPRQAPGSPGEDWFWNGSRWEHPRECETFS
jgi:hypothetical protein